MFAVLGKGGNTTSTRESDKRRLLEYPNFYSLIEEWGGKASRTFPVGGRLRKMPA